MCERKVLCVLSCSESSPIQSQNPIQSLFASRSPCSVLRLRRVPSRATTRFPLPFSTFLPLCDRGCPGAFFFFSLNPPTHHTTPHFTTPPRCSTSTHRLFRSFSLRVADPSRRSLHSIHHVRRSHQSKSKSCPSLDRLISRSPSFTRSTLSLGNRPTAHNSALDFRRNPRQKANT